MAHRIRCGILGGGVCTDLNTARFVPALPRAERKKGPAVDLGREILTYPIVVVTFSCQPPHMRTGGTYNIGGNGLSMNPGGHPMHHEDAGMGIGPYDV